MSFFKVLDQLLQQGERVAMVTVIRNEGSSPRKTGARMLVRADGSIVGTIGGGTVELEVIQRAREVLKNDEPQLFKVHLTRDLGMCCGGGMEFFIEPLSQDPPLVIFGAGHVAQALAPLAQQLGFEVTIIDEREEFNTEERFPGLKRVVDDPMEALKELPYGPNLYIVVVTHLHRLDEDLLRAMATREWHYLGMIGSRAKVAKFVDRLVARGVPPEALDRVTMPIGLNLGALTPAEIAVSIAAELIQVRRTPERSTDGSRTMNWRPKRIESI